MIIFFVGMEWQRARRKNFRTVVDKWDVFPQEGMQGKWSKTTTSYFISNFSDKISAKDIFQLFACIDEVAEVIISPRRNKRERRFGFARFFGVVDIRLLGVRLDNVLIDDVKLHVNLPRFGKRGVSGEGVVERGGVFSGKNGEAVLAGGFVEKNKQRVLVQAQGRSVLRKDEVSFAEVVGQGSEVKKQNINLTKNQTSNHIKLKFSSTLEMRCRL